MENLIKFPYCSFSFSSFYVCCTKPTLIFLAPPMYNERAVMSESQINKIKIAPLRSQCLNQELSDSFCCFYKSFIDTSEFHFRQWRSVKTENKKIF